MTLHYLLLEVRLGCLIVFWGESRVLFSKLTTNSSQGDFILANKLVMQAYLGLK